MSSSGPQARQPRRQRGKKRVEDLLEAAAAIFASKGFDAATMTEIAQRAQAPIGSLYQFFPNKELLARALLERYAARLEAALCELEAEVGRFDTPALADALMGLLAGFGPERTAAVNLMEAIQTPGSSSEMRQALRRRIAGLLRAYAPTLTADEALDMAVIVVQLMKAAAGLAAETGLERREAALTELRQALRLYLGGRLDV